MNDFSVHLPRPIFCQILNNSSLLRRGINPVAELVKSNEFQDVLIHKYRGNRRGRQSGPLLPRNSRRIAGRMKLLYNLKLRHYKTKQLLLQIYEDQLFFNYIFNNFLNIDVDEMFDIYNRYLARPLNIIIT